MSKILPVKLVVPVLSLYFLPLNQPLFAQNQDPFEINEEGWGDDDLDGPSEEPAPAKPVENKPSKPAYQPPIKQVSPPISKPPQSQLNATPSTTPQRVISKPKAVFEPITQTRSEYTVSSVVKHVGPPLLLIARPVYAPYSNEGNTMFISATAEAYFHFIFGALPGIQVVPFERIANNIQYFREFTRRISRAAYIKAAEKIGASYLFYQEYEPKGKNVKFATELYAITGNKKIAGSIAEIPLADFEKGLSNFVTEVATALIGNLPQQVQEILAAPVMGSNQRQIELLGQAIVAEGDFSRQHAEKVAPDFEKMAKDRSMHLARFIGAQVMARSHQFEKAIALQQQLSSTFGERYPGLYLQLAAYYRMQRSYQDALEAVADAGKEPSLKIPVQIEKARIYEAEGKLDKAKREYESVLSAGGEDGEIYFQLALVSIGLNDLAQAERYLEKAAGAGRSLDRGDYFDLGVRYEALGTASEQAIKAFRNCIGLQQDNEEAWQKLAGIYSVTGREAEAAECYVSLFHINNNLYKDYLIKAGIMFENAGYLENAKDAYALFLARRFENTEVSVRLAKLEMQSGNCSKAIELVDDVDTLGEFGPDVIAINTQCGKQVRRVEIPTGGGRDKGWRAVFFWRVASGAVAIAGVAGGFIMNGQAKEKYEQYIKARTRVDADNLRKQVETFAMVRNLSYLGGGIGVTSFGLSITLPIVISKN